jgi:hypothetical protein
MGALSGLTVIRSEPETAENSREGDFRVVILPPRVIWRFGIKPDSILATSASMGTDPIRHPNRTLGGAENRDQCPLISISLLVQMVRRAS